MTNNAVYQGDRDPKKYRPNAGIVVFSEKGLVFVGRRAGSEGPHQWQFPQGGIDAGEDTKDGALRELEEETGISRKHIDVLGEIEPWLYYDFPADLKSRLSGPYSGQKQKWYAVRFKGAEGDIRLDLHDPEFDAWKWIELKDVPNLIIPFKRPVYEEVVKEFSRFCEN
jgi:putative (di)nucleoside polyphosphate hydrolase